jgi:putative glutamine amidotransferase
VRILGEMAVPVGITNCGDQKILPYEVALRVVGIEPVRLSAGAPKSLDGLYGLLLTGGTDINPRRYGQAPIEETQPADDARDDMEFGLLGEALAMDLPVFAICRGMQLLNIHLHGTLHQHLASLSIHRQVFPGDPPGRQRTVHNVDLKPNTILAAVVGQPSVPVNSRHHQAVDRLGPGVIVSGVSEDGITEAIEYPARRFVLGVQWHPEDRIEAGAADRALFEAFAKEVSR